MKKPKKEIVKIDISKEDYKIIKYAAKKCGMSIQKFVESAIYIEMINSLKTFRKEDLEKIYDDE